LQFWASYAPHADWEPAAAIETRVAALLPMLMLARIDGKSPVEYLSEPVRTEIRAMAIPLITRPPATIAELIDRLT